MPTPPAPGAEGLVLHLGMPKTATTAMQHALRAAAPALLERGFDYPPILGGKNASAHHDLPLGMLAGGEAAQAARQTLLRHVRRSPAPRILISSEGFTNLFRPGRLQALLRLVAKLAALRPVTLVLSLRRIDDFLLSMYLHQVKVGTVDRDVDAYLAGRDAWIERFFAAIAALREAGTARLETPVYRGAGFLDTLWPVLGLTAEEVALLPRDTRPNAQLGLKAQTLLMGLPVFAARAGVTVPSRLALVRFLEDNPTLFQGEIPRFDPMPPARRAAAAHGVHAYAEAFAADPPPAWPPARLDPGLITPDDLARLVDAGRAAGVLRPACATGPAA
ncbi:MAG: hypothetical protein KatS3mg118_3478 [Paracoccaceae bacterium]|nr:MAG: hypothetical protein KatS3mg118_3478 [Paracoccaceae bacterium]